MNPVHATGSHRCTATRRRLLRTALISSLATWVPLTAQAAFDHDHAAWSALLKAHVVVAPDGHSSRVDYAALQREHGALRDYLAHLSAVSRSEYATWSRAQQLAFLINAYNAFTIELVLTRYPAVKSIKELGSLFESPWKKEFFRLLGRQRSLDAVEHGLIRAPGAFDDPRIHFAVVCASVGCPMLRNEAFAAGRLDAQLDDSMRRFLSDRSRNRYELRSNTLAVSRIFDWYRGDFEQGHRGMDSLATLFAWHAEQLAATPEGRAAVRAGRYSIDHLDYDWALNDLR